MILPDTQRFMAERMGANIRSHKVDHTPMHTAPELVVDIILEAAQSTSENNSLGRGRPSNQMNGIRGPYHSVNRE
jgi:hypothetical protein